MNESRLVDGSLRPLIALLEQLYCQNLAMKQILSGIPALDWKKNLLEGLKDIEIEGEVRKKFASLYESLGDETALHEAIQEFLNIKKVGLMR
jgi:hypothetical protein